MVVENYTELIAWQKAMDLVEEVYRAAQRFPREEVYGLGSQIKRAAISVPSNIAEGQGRTSRKEFLRHLSVAYGSLREVETHVLIAERLHYLAPGETQVLMDLAGEVGRLLNGLSKSLCAKSSL